MALLLLLGVLAVKLATGEEVIEQVKPYAFTYTAGRAPGHTDRVHSEVSDGNGVIKGMFSYVDPRHQIRTVEYVADQFGFHPLHITQPNHDTPAVANEKLKHAALYQKIALEQQQIALERGQTDFDDGSYKPGPEENYTPAQGPIILPKDTKTVYKAKVKHFELYDKIAQEHAQIADERGHPLIN